MYSEHSYHTAEGMAKIQEELNKLRQERREISALLQVAAEKGDINENGDYHTLKDRQGLLEAQIRKWEGLLRNGTIIEKNCDGIIGVGNQVKLKAGIEIKEFQLVGPEEIDLNNGKISYESPLGQALMGKRKGDIVEVQVPKGNIKYKIIEVK